MACRRSVTVMLSISAMLMERQVPLVYLIVNLRRTLVSGHQIILRVSGAF
jgi:hypothetical protein